MGMAAAFPGFKLRLTRWGSVYLAFMLVLGFAAVNTGNNALMATLGLGLAAYAVAGTWSREVLGKVQVRVTPPSEVFAGRPAVFEVALSNSSRVFPAYGVLVRDDKGRVVLMEPLVPRGESICRPVELTLSQRGWVELGRWTIEVLLPLGFFVKSKQIGGELRLLVYPELLPVSSVNPGSGHGQQLDEAWQPRGREGEVTQLRSYREGDELRQIHWKQSARQHDLIAVDRQRQAAAPAYFVVDPRLEDPTSPHALARFERLLSEVATAVVEAIRQGRSVGVIVGSTAAGPFSQRRSLGALLTPLAEAQALAAEVELEMASPPGRACPIGPWP